jgi:hypothetical protein
MRMIFQQEKHPLDAVFGFVSGPDFSRAAQGLKENWALAPAALLNQLLQSTRTCGELISAIAALE